MTDQSWETITQPVITFECDSGLILGFIFVHLESAACDRDQLLLHWPPGTITVTGPGALAFYKDFAKGKGSWLVADQKEILSVTYQSRAEADAERDATKINL